MGENVQHWLFPPLSLIALFTDAVFLETDFRIFRVPLFKLDPFKIIPIIFLCFDLFNQYIYLNFWQAFFIFNTLKNPGIQITSPPPIPVH